jgi:hypothetical protein
MTVLAWCEADGVVPLDRQSRRREEEDPNRARVKTWLVGPTWKRLTEEKGEGKRNGPRGCAFGPLGQGRRAELGRIRFSLFFSLFFFYFLLYFKFTIFNSNSNFLFWSSNSQYQIWFMNIYATIFSISIYSPSPYIILVINDSITICFLIFSFMFSI